VVPSQREEQEKVRDLQKYMCKVKNPQLYLFCTKIIERFSDKENLRECHHPMHSQNNEAINRSIMRYCPKEKTFCRSMGLTSRINIAIGVDTLGHAESYKKLFKAMNFQPTKLTNSGLRRMWRKKEYGRIYFRLRTVKIRRRIKNQDKMAEGNKKMEEDVLDGRDYASGLRLQDDNEDEDDDMSD
jgi:hypothetical protein